MALRSNLFKGDTKLEACAVSHPAHILQGHVGAHVGKIQAALAALDGAVIDAAELSSTRYGKSTAAAVLSYKKKRSIINPSYQTTPDDIVGKMTIASLDDEMAKKEQAPPPAPPPTMSALATRDKLVSLQWAGAAIAGLTATRGFLVSPPPGPLPGMPPIAPPVVRVTFDALEAHFHFSTVAGSKVAFIDAVLAIFGKAVNTLNNSGNVFIDDTTSAEAAKGTPAHVPFGTGKVNFTPAFKERDTATGTGFGPKARAAMVLHEPIHVVDHPAASTAANHVSELSGTYATQPAANQLHNAHSYAAFGQHIFFGRDTRFGAGKPDQ